MLVVAYALAGTMNIDFASDPLGQDAEGQDVFLRDIWPSTKEITETVRHAVTTAQFEDRYAAVFEGTGQWREVEVPAGSRYAWDDASTYIRNPPFFDAVEKGEPPALTDIAGARVLALLGDTVTTDHISPAGAIASDSPAAAYLREHGVSPRDFNSYGSRRGNHEVMMRGTFANIRLRNLLAPGTEGGITRHLPSGEQTSIFEASMKYQAAGTPLIVIAGKEYGTGSSRDWAAKGTFLLGVKAVITKSYERIHRSNLIGMGVLPLEFLPGRRPGRARADRRGGLLHRRHRRRPRARQATHRGYRVGHDLRGGHAPSIPPRRSSTTGTAASFSTCCASWRAESRFGVVERQAE